MSSVRSVMEFDDENEYGQEGEGLEEAYPERGGALVPAGGAPSASSALAQAVEAERMLAPHNGKRICVPIEMRIPVSEVGAARVNILGSVMRSLSSKKERNRLMGKSFFVLAAGYGGALVSSAPYPIHVRTGIRAADVILPKSADELAEIEKDKMASKSYRKHVKALNTFTFSIAPGTNAHLAETRYFYCPVPHPTAAEKLEAYAPELTGRSIWGERIEKTFVYKKDERGRKTNETEEVYSVDRYSRGVEKLLVFQQDASVTQVTRGIVAEIDVQNRALIPIDEKEFVEAEFEKNRQTWGLPHNFAFKEGDPFFDITFVPGNAFHGKEKDKDAKMWNNFKHTAIQNSESMQKRVRDEGIYIQMNLCFELCTTRD